MNCLYMQLDYTSYKRLEEQMKTFRETTHTSMPGPFYHKSIRLQIDDNTVIEFHGPNVRGQQA